MDKKKKINDFNLAGLAEGVALAKKRPGAKRAPKTCRVEWRRGVKFETFIRKHSFIIDEPRRLGGEDEHPNSMEYVLGAYGACLATGFVMNASKKGVEIEELSVEIESTQDNALTFLGLATDGHPGFDRIEAKLKVKSKADPGAIQALWELTVRTSPVHNTLAEAVTLEATVELDPQSV